MKNVLLLILLLGMLPIIEVAGQSNSEVETNEQTYSDVRQVMWKKTISKSRSIPLEQFIDASVCDNKLTISSSIPLDDVSIKISSETGETLYTTRISTIQIVDADVPLFEIKESVKYILEISTENAYCIGHF